ncbi:MAG: L-threonylcarbamoyladenylate synthase [Actinomycetes bacterium]
MTYRVIPTTDAEEAFDAAAQAVADGEVIVLPTDTVYGVGADATSGAAVQRLLDAKQRGRDFPPPVLVAEAAMVRALATGIDERLTGLAEAFWPGALTLVLNARDTLRMDLGDRGHTIAVRVPDHAFTRELLRRTGPLAVSSANVHGQDAALTIEQATDQLGDSCSLYLDDGTMSGPVPSTIVDLTGARARILRQGRISAEELNAAVPGLVAVAEPEQEAAPAADLAQHPAPEDAPDAGPTQEDEPDADVRAGGATGD